MKKIDIYLTNVNPKVKNVVIDNLEKHGFNVIDCTIDSDRKVTNIEVYRKRKQIMEENISKNL